MVQRRAVGSLSLTTVVVVVVEQLFLRCASGAKRIKLWTVVLRRAVGGSPVLIWCFVVCCFWVCRGV